MPGEDIEADSSSPAARKRLRGDEYDLPRPRSGPGVVRGHVHAEARVVRRRFIPGRPFWIGDWTAPYYLAQAEAFLAAEN